LEFEVDTSSKSLIEGKYALGSHDRLLDEDFEIVFGFALIELEVVRFADSFNCIATHLVIDRLEENQHRD